MGSSRVRIRPETRGGYFASPPPPPNSTRQTRARDAGRRRAIGSVRASRRQTLRESPRVMSLRWKRGHARDVRRRRRGVDRHRVGAKPFSVPLRRRQGEGEAVVDFRATSFDSSTRRSTPRVSKTSTTDPWTSFSPIASTTPGSVSVCYPRLTASADARLAVPDAVCAPSRVVVRAALLRLRVEDVAGFDLRSLNAYRWHPQAARVDLRREPTRAFLSEPFVAARWTSPRGSAKDARGSATSDRDDDDDEFEVPRRGNTTRRFAFP